MLNCHEFDIELASHSGSPVLDNDRQAVLERLVRGWVARDRLGDDADDLPIAVLWGARTGKTSELLEHLKELRDWPGPRAYLDGEHLPGVKRPHEVANLLVFALGARTADFERGRLRFPRFALGLAAAREPLNPNDTNARADRLAEWRRRLRRTHDGLTWLREIGASFARLAGLPPDEADLVGLAAGTLFQATRVLRLLRSAGMRWYRDQEGLAEPPFVDPLEGLVEVSADAYRGAWQKIDRVLYRAFLADLRAEYRRNNMTVRRTNALVLLDNVSTSRMSAFLDMVAKEEIGSGPLAIVAATHQRYPEVAAQDPTRWQPDRLADASIARWAAQRSGRGGSRFYPIWVDPVDDVEATSIPDREAVEWIAAAHRFGRDQYTAISFVHRLTEGHPGGLRLITRALGHEDHENPPTFLPVERDERGLLRWPAGDDGALDERVFDQVLGPRPEAIRRGLVLMAMAVDLSDARMGPIVAAEPLAVARQLQNFRARDLWVLWQVEDGVARPPRMHPFARRTIAHRLAQPGGIEDIGLDWRQAHELLREGAVSQGDQIAELYHSLALGQVQRVAERLSELYDPVCPQGWYQLLLQVTAAPLEQPDYGAGTSANFERLCSNDAAEPKVTRRLVAALQLHSDPLADPGHQMCGIVAAELGQLRLDGKAGAPFVVAQSHRFDLCSARWELLRETL